MRIKMIRIFEAGCSFGGIMARARSLAIEDFRFWLTGRRQGNFLLDLSLRSKGHGQKIRSGNRIALRIRVIRIRNPIYF